MIFKKIWNKILTIMKFPFKIIDYYSGMINEYSVEYWQNYIFYCFCIFGIAAIFLLLIPASIYLVSKGQLVFCIINIVLFVINVSIIFLKVIPLKIKAVFVSIILYLVGLFTFIFGGPAGQHGIWFASAALLAGLFANTVISIIISGLSLLTGIIVALLFNEGLISWYYIKDYSYFGIIIQSLSIFFISLMFIFSNSTLIKGVKQAFRVLNKSKEATIIGLAKLAEYRDTDTGTHLERIRDYTLLLVKALSEKEKYHDYIDKQYIYDIQISSVLHDIGKVGISDSILLKPGKLSDEEFNAIKQHSIIGKDVIYEISKHLEDRSIYNMSENIAQYHHEKWDGTGYMSRLSGEKIPLSARIVSLIDVYDAMTSRRVYKDALTHEEALDFIISQKGIHFDPYIVDVFLSIEYKILDLNKSFLKN